MTRITENQLSRSMMHDVLRNRQQVNKFGSQLSSGYKVTTPGDSKHSGTISQYRELLARIEGHSNRIKGLEGALSFQEEIVSQAGDAMIRAKEIATQAANETNGTEERKLLAAEVWELRDHLMSLANSKYQGKYIYGGAVDNAAPYSPGVPYTNPSEGPASQRYRFNVANAAGTDIVRQVNITDDTRINMNTPGNEIFDNALHALERLGRALEGYETELDGNGVPNGGGDAFTFPADKEQQTNDILAAIDLLETARNEDFMTEQISLGGRMKRLQSAESILEMSSVSAQDVLNRLQNADFVESASYLAEAQGALEASLMVSSMVLNQSILDYL